MNLYPASIISTGYYIPKKVVTNFDLSKTLDTSDEWIFERTGIKERHIASREGGEFPSDMAEKASRMAIENAKMSVNDIDLIILSSVTPDAPLPCTSSFVQKKLGMTNLAPCLDISPACSGFVYGIHLANSLIASGAHKNILVIGTEMLSSAVDWRDRSMCVLFGDGAGAVVVSRTEQDNQSKILASVLHTDSTGGEFFDWPYGGSVLPLTSEKIKEGDHFMRMKGREMFKVATRTLCQNAKDVLEMANLKAEDINWLIPHQANARIIEKTADLLDFPMEKVIMNIDKYGNTSAATIPIAFHEAVTEGKIKKGDIVMFDTFGAGLTSGAVIFKY